MGQLEARFTISGEYEEIPFTIFSDDQSNMFLYSVYNNQEFRFLLKNDNGLLRLAEENPFSESQEIVDERLTGMSADWIESRSQGFENSFEFEELNSPGYGPDDIFVENKPFSLKQILELIKDGDIELTPDFQRNFIWDKTRQSKLIESILLGLPLPSIYLSQYDDGRLTVVDGLQRLSTIQSFMNDELVLNNLEYLTECNRLKYSELDSVLSPLRLRKFGQTQIMCFVLDYRSPSKLKFDLFRRLNTGGKPLNNQEIRNCLSRPAVQRVLKTMISLQSFEDATDRSVKDARMDAREAALRFLYFIDQYSPNESNPTGKYSGDMESTLDNFIDTLNLRDITELQEYIPVYDRGLRNAYHLFDTYCFRKVTLSTYNTRRSPVNKLLMLTFSILLSKYDSLIIFDKYEKGDLIKPLADFIDSNEEVFRAITWGTNGKWNLVTCFNNFQIFLTEKLGDGQY